MTLRLRDVRGGAAEVPAVSGRVAHVGFVVAPDPSVTVARAVHADVVRRTLDRRGVVVDVTAIGELPSAVADGLLEMNCRPPGDAVGVPLVVVGDDGPDDCVVCAPRAASAPTGGAPLATRLAMLDDDVDVAAAAAELERWRGAVAAWAEHPSKPMCADYVAWCDAALDDDLDTPRVLGLMREVEGHPDLPPGSKFETFAYLDRVLGLDLAARVGLSR